MTRNAAMLADAQRVRHAIGKAWRSASEWVFPVRPVKSYSQQGEDLILSHLLSVAGITKPFYVDIGSNDPVILSNTYLFYRSGGQGVCVEPNTRYNARYRRYRPRDTLLNVGVTTEATTSLPYYEMDWPEFNTFDKKQAEAVQSRYGDRNAIRRVASLPLLNVNELLNDYVRRPVDVLSLDVEGLDARILAAIDFTRWSPTFICVEHSELTQSSDQPAAESIEALLCTNGYVLEAYNSINGIYRLATS